jgi:uncharacterized membrane protein (UPF0182 family)
MAAAQPASVRARPRRAPAERISLWRTPRVRSLIVLGTLGAAAGLVALVARVYTDLLWFHELGLGRVFVTTLAWKVLARGAAGLGTTCALLLTFAVAERLAPRGVSSGGHAIRVLQQSRRLVYPVVAIACGVIAMHAEPRFTWKLLLLWANRSDFGVNEPLFHRDVGFFVFSLPLYEQVVRWLLLTVLMAAAATLGTYLLAGGPGRWLVATRGVRTHLLALAAILLLCLAWRTRLEQLALAVPHGRSPVPGASYTDIHVVSPELEALALAAVAGAALCLLAIVRRVPVAAYAGLAAVAALLLVGGGELSALVERFGVQPQALARERPQLAVAIAATQRAFALDHVDVHTIPRDARLSARDLRANRATLDNVPLWDTRVLRPALNDLQSIGRYYHFPRATVDRYTVGGRPQVMTVAARQLDLARLSPAERSWANERFAYTHGYGVVAVRANATDTDLEPRFAQREFTLRHNPLGLREPRIYYGERLDSDPPYLVAHTGRGEIDAPLPGSRKPDYHYDGDAGIALSSPLRRAAFAARFGDLRLLLTQTISSRSRLLLHRNVRERVQALAPFLRWDVDAQTAVIDGRVQFLFHGYTTSDHYPNSARVTMGGDAVNYVREAAVAAVDGFSGHVSLYATDPTDPILRGWRSAYPGLFRPAEQMSPDLRAHLRYPEQLFAAQAAAYATYHAGEPTAFWNGTDAWQPPEQLAGPVERAGEIRFPNPSRHGGTDPARSTLRLRPGYLFARLPGDSTERLTLATPFTPRGGQNLVAYLAGSRDDGGVPRLTLLSLPRDRLAIGPSQATRQILATPGVNQTLQLLNRESRDLGHASINRTIVGAPRVIPVAGRIIYVQPLYLTSAGNGLPRLALVTVLVNGRVGYGHTLRAALRRALAFSRAR